MKSALLLLYNVELYPAGQHAPKLVKYQGCGWNSFSTTRILWTRWNNSFIRWAEAAFKSWTSSSIFCILKFQKCFLTAFLRGTYDYRYLSGRIFRYLSNLDKGIRCEYLLAFIPLILKILKRIFHNGKNFWREKHDRIYSMAQVLKGALMMISMLIASVLLTLAPVLLVQLTGLLCGRRSTAVHYLWAYILIIYIWLVFTITGIGSIWDIISKGGLAAAVRQANLSLLPFQSEGLFTYWTNIVMFIPLGFLLPYIWENYRSPVKVALSGFFLSLSIEFAQLATNRVSDIDDLLTNTLGAVSGYGLWMLLGRHFFGRREERRTVALGNWEAVLYLVSAYMCNFLLNNKAWFI